MMGTTRFKGRTTALGLPRICRFNFQRTSVAVCELVSGTESFLYMVTCPADIVGLDEKPDSTRVGMTVRRDMQTSAKIRCTGT